MSCQWCKAAFGRSETVKPYGGKWYHIDCWLALEQMAKTLGKAL